MSRNLGPRCKQCRREMTPLLLKGQRCLTEKCPLKGKKKYPPGPPRKKRIKLSDYAVQLREKQKIKRSYCLLEKQFRTMFDQASRMKGVTGDNMLSLLERRLDNVLYRMGFASSRLQARQLIAHRHVLINGKTVTIPSYRIKEGAEIEIKEKSKENVMLHDSIKLSKAVDSVPEWIETDFEGKKGKVVRLPVIGDIDSNFNVQLVVELYSK
jgi:small subunit ribosomal protein S4